MSKKTVLSPHLGIYKPQITSSSSILGRIAGVVTYITFASLLILFAFSASHGNILMLFKMVLNYPFNANTPLLCAIPLRIMISGIFFAMFLYLCTLIRHIVWDFGFLLHIKYAKILGYSCFVISGILTAIFMTMLIL